MDTVQVLYLDGSEPHPAAVKLMIAVARAGRNLAAQLVSIVYCYRPYC